MTKKAGFLILAAVVLSAFCVGRTSARGVFPSIADLEYDLHLHPGQQLPRDVQASSGAIFHAYYVKGRAQGNGYYEIVVKLDR